MHDETTFASPEEKVYQDYLRRGDDFFRIGLFRNAREMYSKALETQFDPATIQDKLERCSSELRFTRNVLIILVAIATVAVTVAMIL